MKNYKKYSYFYITALVIGVMGISGCSKVQKELGMGRNSPDEFTVIKRAPLSLPPEYDLLPPDPDRQTPLGAETRNVTVKAQSVIFGADSQKEVSERNQTPETSLLNRIGTSKADPNIRKTLDRETGYVILDEEKTLTEKIMFWQDNSNKETSVIDAKKEKTRIEENDKEGLPINSGDVPTIEKKQSTLDKLF